MIGFPKSNDEDGFTGLLDFGSFYLAMNCDGVGTKIEIARQIQKFEGKEDEVDRALLWCHQGPSYASVTKVETKEEPFVGEFDSFSITY